MTTSPVSSGSNASYTTPQSVKDREALREEADAILNAGKKQEKPVYKNENERKRARIEELMTDMGKMKGDLDGKISSALRSMGVSTEIMKDLKIEIGSDGKVVVGGLKDETLAKQIQHRLREERSLLGDLHKYQKAERELAAEMGGTAWNDIKKATLQSNGSPDLTDIIENNPFLKDASDLAYGLAATFSREDVDFHHDRKGVANPVGALKNLMTDAKGRINELFNQENTKATEYSKTGGIAAMSLDNVRVTMSSNGDIKIEGKFSEDEDMNRRAEAIVRAELGKIMGAEGTGKENTLQTAARELAFKHQAEHGFIVEDKTVVMELSGGGSKAYIETETGGDTLKDSIKKEALRYYRETRGIENARVNLDGLDVDGSGKLVLKNSENSDANAQALVDELNQILTTGPELYTDIQQVTGLFMATKIKEIMSYGAKGKDDYSGHEFMEYREKTFRDEAEATVKKNRMPGIEVYG